MDIATAPIRSRRNHHSGQIYLRSNAPAGDCGCFSLNGGNLNVALPTMRSRFSPFAEVLVGLAHTNGSLVEANASSKSNKGAAFASLVGGGLDMRASRHYAIRLIEADYLVTTVSNGSNDHQNNLRISTGTVLRF